MCYNIEVFYVFIKDKCIKFEKIYNLKLRINSRNFVKLVMAGFKLILLWVDIDIYVCLLL